MKTFHCTHCQSLVFFENTRCLNCSHPLAYLTDQMTMAALEQGQDGLWRQAAWQNRAYKLCENYVSYDVCNWAIPAEDTASLCHSCRLTRVIPNLSQHGNREAWYRLETAKRRLIYTILGLKLPLIGKSDDASGGLAFEFLSDSVKTNGDRSRVMTGHDNGVITINVAEADDVYREQQRTQQREPYRTVLGHFRHEIGHYYLDRLIRNGPHLEQFRHLFGDERADYQKALNQHYSNGPPANWEDDFISAYASAHPWEDWAESWAHVMHMTDALETARSVGLSMEPGRADEPSLSRQAVSPKGAFDQMVQAWFSLTYALNNLSRGFGLADSYPFVLSARVIDKLRFVHNTIVSSADQVRAA